MKKNILFLFGTILGLSLSFTSCDKVSNPIKPEITVDTTIFPGNWEDYTFPTFTQNTNTNRNVMLEDYTGHRCPACPAAGWEAYNIEQANPTRIFVSSVHASPGGLSSFQNLASDCGEASNPNDQFCTVFYCDEGEEYGSVFGGADVGFFANPQGNINRINFTGNDIFSTLTSWQTKVDGVIAANDLKVNIQAQSNYYTETNGFYLHTEAEFLEDLPGSQYNMVVNLMENEVKDYQDSLGVKVSKYKHHNIFRGCIDGLAWGRTIPVSYTVGSKSTLDYSYKLPDGMINTDYHLLIYVYDVDTYEVLQVIKHEF